MNDGFKIVLKRELYRCNRKDSYEWISNTSKDSFIGNHLFIQCLFFYV